MVHVIFGGQLFSQVVNLFVLNKDLSLELPLCDPSCKISKTIQKKFQINKIRLQITNHKSKEIVNYK